MSWLASNHLLSAAIELYRASDVGPMQTAFWLLSQSKRPLASEKETLAVIIACEAFAAVSDEPSEELNLAEIGPRAILFQRNLWNVDLLAIQAAESLQQSRFFKEGWLGNFADLKLRLERVSVRYEDHRRNPNRGVTILD